MVEPIKIVIMRRDDMSEEDAEALIKEAKADLWQLIDDGGSLIEAENIVESYFGLEPDYLEELLPL